MKRAGVALLALWPSVAAGGDVFAGYSALRLDGDNVNGASVSVAWPLSGAVGLGVEASGQLGRARGDDVEQWAALAGPVLAPWRESRFSPYLHAMAGAIRSRRQLEVFGVAIGSEGVCDGGCPFQMGLVAQIGGGLDTRLTPSFSLRLPQFDYRLTRAAGDTAGQLRASAGVVYRWGR